MVVSLSTNALKLYSPQSGQYFGDCVGHSATVNHISFTGPSPHVLHSCSSDGTIRAWDSRSFQQDLIRKCSASHLAGREIIFLYLVVRTRFRSGIGGPRGRWLAWRNPIWMMSLRCVFGTSATNEATFQDAHSQASNSWILDNVDYLIDCHYSSEDDRLWVIGGTNSGSFGYFPVTYKGNRSIGPSEAIFKGGHADIVRCVLPVSSMPGTVIQSHGIFGWTGGEDGLLCCWRSDESSNANRSWISSTLVSKSPKNSRQNRHHPY